MDKKYALRFDRGIVHMLPLLIIMLALPIFVWALWSQNFDIRRRAATIEPPTPTPAPTVTAVIGPTPIPIPAPNALPQISTDSLPVALVNRNYYAEIKGYDPNESDNLDMNISGLPSGISRGPCSLFKSGGQANILCVISGKPTKKGTYNVYVTITDGRGGFANKTLELKVLPRFLIF